MEKKNMETTSLAERQDMSLMEKAEEEKALVKKEMKETAVVKKEKEEKALVKKEKAEKALAKKEKKETAVVKKEKEEKALAKKEKAEKAPAKKEKAIGSGKKAAVRKIKATNAAAKKKSMEYMDVVEIVRKKCRPADPLLISPDLALQLNVSGPGNGIFYIEVKDGVLSIEPYDYYDRHAELFLSSADLFAILDQKLSVEEALEEGRLRIEGDWEKAMEIRKLIQQI